MKTPKIEGYSFGNIVIDGRQYSKDLIIYPDHIDCPWWRKDGHSLVSEDVSEILQAPPDFLVVGTGSPGLLRLPAATHRRLKEAGMEVIIESTEQACKTYNRLRSQGRTVAALHLTC